MHLQLQRPPQGRPVEVLNSPPAADPMLISSDHLSQPI
jgi:hypothetical protein